MSSKTPPPAKPPKAAGPKKPSSFWSRVSEAIGEALFGGQR